MAPELTQLIVDISYVTMPVFLLIGGYQFVFKKNYKFAAIMFFCAWFVARLLGVLGSTD